MGKETIELVNRIADSDLFRWQEDTCFTLASWVPHKEGFDLKFVGSRPFEHADPLTFWRLAEVGDKHLEEHFRKTKCE